jgi:hypothetical protein
MKRFLALATICTLWIPGVALAKTNQVAPLTGRWECVAHGFPQGDVNFTLYLTQNPDNSVTGWVAAPMGSTDLTSVVFKNKNLEIHIDTPQGNYHINGKYEKNQVSGIWSKDSTLKGRWEGKKLSASPDPKQIGSVDILKEG